LGNSGGYKKEFTIPRTTNAKKEAPSAVQSTPQVI